jgi:helicase MOV-10
VLVCAPSNTATDLIATRLSKIHSPSELLRLNAPSRGFDSLPPDLRKYSPVDGRMFKAPPKEELKRFKIIASTCFYASIPRALGVQDHFTHIFVDEAGHATEPEIMVAVLQNASPRTNVIVCGDVSDSFGRAHNGSAESMISPRLAHATRPYCPVQCMCKTRHERQLP